MGRRTTWQRKQEEQDSLEFYRQHWVGAAGKCGRSSSRKVA